jgi:cytochrome c
MFFSCVNDKKFPQESKTDSVQILNTYINSLNDSIHILNDSIIIIKNKNLNIEKLEIVNLGELKGKTLYTKHCKFCHGNFGQGDGIKAKVNKDLCPFDLRKESSPDQAVYYVLLNGLNKMPSQKELSYNDIWILVIYIKNFKN